MESHATCLLHLQAELTQKWLGLDAGVKSQIEGLLLQALTTQVHLHFPSSTSSGCMHGCTNLALSGENVVLGSTSPGKLVKNTLSAPPDSELDIKRDSDSLHVTLHNPRDYPFVRSNRGDDLLKNPIL